MTQPGSTFGFTVWGRKENMMIFGVLNQVMAKHGLLPPTPPIKTPYDLGKNPDALKTEMEAMGYTNIRMWYQKVIYHYASEDDYAT